VVVKRQDGSCCSRVRVTESCSVAELQATIQQVEVRRTDGLKLLLLQQLAVLQH
jgi:hypothetical protein